MYFVVSKTGSLSVEGRLPLTAHEAIAVAERANGDSQIEFRDRDGKPVSLDQLREEAGR